MATERLNIVIGGNASGAVNALRAVSMAGKAMQATLIGAGLFAVAKLTQAIVAVPRAFGNAIDEADQMLEAAQKSGSSVEALSAISHAAELAGTSVEALTTASRHLAKEYQMALLPSLLATADQFAQMTDETAKIEIATKRFGKAGQDLIPLLNQGSAAILEQMQEAEKLGLVIGEDFAKSADAFNDSMARIWGSVRGRFMKLVEALLPTLEKLALTLEEVFTNPTVLAAIDAFFKMLVGGLERFVATLEGVNKILGWFGFKLPAAEASGAAKSPSALGDLGAEQARARERFAREEAKEKEKERKAAARGERREGLGFSLPQSEGVSWTTRGFLSAGEAQAAAQQADYTKRMAGFLETIMYYTSFLPRMEAQQPEAY